MEGGLIDIFSLSKDERIAYFIDAKANVPNIDLSSLRSQIEKKKIPTDPNNDSEFRQALAELRWNNPICEECLTKSKKLYVCQACKLSFYCSLDCKEKDNEIHSKRCCILDGPMDIGPQRIVLLEKKPKRKIDVPNFTSKEDIWNFLTELSSEFEKTSKAEDMCRVISMCLIKLKQDYDMEFQDMEREFRGRKLSFWIFAENACSTPQYDCINITNMKHSIYALSISVGSRSRFENHDLKRNRRTYEENFDILNECGVWNLKKE